MRYLLVIAILLIKLPLLACSCSAFSEDFEEVSRFLGQVFQGTIIKQVIEPNEVPYYPETFAPRTIWVEVDHVWLGAMNVGDTIQINYHHISSCGFTTMENDEFIFTLAKTEPVPLECYCGLATEENIRKVDSYFNPVLASKLGAGSAIFPNPARFELNIECASELLSVRILDTSGRIILKSTEQKINISTIPKGIYLVEMVQSDGSIKTERLVKH